MEDKLEIIHGLKNVKLVLGNGFDLRCGLKTRYKDYFDHDGQKNDKIKELVDLFSMILDLISNKGKDPQTDAVSWYKSMSDFWAEFDEKNETAVDLSNINIWDVFFYMVSKVESAKLGQWRWCDIETKIKESLYKEEERAQNSGKENYISWDTVFAILSNGINRVQFDSKYYDNCELALFIYRKNDNKGFPTIDAFYKYLLKQLKEFERDFGNYICTQHCEDNIVVLGNHELLKNRMMFVGNSKRAIKQLCPLENIVSIDTFNYDTPDIEEKADFVHNINGDTREPIFGIDSSCFKASDPRFIFAKIKRRLDLEAQMKVTQKTIPFENLIIYGHSLDEADYGYFFSTLSKMRIDDTSNSSKVIFGFSIYDDSKREQIIADLSLRISRLFEAYSEYYVNEKRPLILLESLKEQGRVLMQEIPNDTAITN